MLEVGASSIVGGKPGFLARIVSTITSSTFSEVVVFYRSCDFRGVNHMGGFHHDPFRSMTRAGIAQEASRHHRRFEVLREMHEVRSFRLVFHVDVWDRVGEYTMRVLKQAVAAEKAGVGFDSRFPEPLLVYSPRRHSPEFLEEFSPHSYYGWLPW